MTMFGINVPINNFVSNSNLVEHTVDSILKRSEERKVFNKFLESETVGGIKVMDRITQSAYYDTHNLIDSGTEVAQNVLMDFAVSSLKSKQTDGLTTYDSLVRKIIEKQNPQFAKLHTQIIEGKFDGRLPLGYPDASKNADGILKAKIKDSIGGLKEEYLVRKLFGEKVRNLTREMFFGINKLGLQGDQLNSYLNIIFETSEIQDCEPTKFFDFKSMVGESILTSSDIRLVHIKCLRFVYPKSGGVKILTDTNDVVIEGVLGNYSPKSEKNLFPRLSKIKTIFEKNGVGTDFEIVVADDDLEVLFPPGNSYVSGENLSEARIDSHKYLEILRNNFGSGFSFKTISELAIGNKKFESLRANVLRDIKVRGGKYVNPEFFERDRVDHQYIYYQQLFGSRYSRQEARRSITEQTANTIALQEVLMTINGGQVILIEENRGGENKLIANGSVPIIFTKLRDESVFDVE